MPFADYQAFNLMTDKALLEGFVFPAFNVHDIFTLNGVIEGFAAAGSDGIVQIYPDAARAVSGAAESPFIGAVTLAEHAQRLADVYDVLIAVHTDHCGHEDAPGYLEPLIEETRRRRAAGGRNLFTSHMFDGSALPISENLTYSKHFLELCRANELWLEIEIGIVGAESGPENEGPNKVYTAPEDFVAVRDAFGVESSRGLLVAPAFGNVHGVYKPGEVSLDPEVLRTCQEALTGERFGDSAAAAGAAVRDKGFKLVFHGGSGSGPEDIARAAAYGVVKMNFDTDGQYVFTRGVADYMYKNYDKLLRIDGEMGVKLAYFAETWLNRGKEDLKQFVSDTCHLLGSAGKSAG